LKNKLSGLRETVWFSSSRALFGF